MANTNKAADSINKPSVAANNNDPAQAKNRVSEINTLKNQLKQSNINNANVKNQLKLANNNCDEAKKCNAKLKIELNSAKNAQAFDQKQIANLKNEIEKLKQNNALENSKSAIALDASFFESKKFEAKILRGDLIDVFAKIECLMSRILYNLSKETEYREKIKKTAPQFSSILNATLEICNIDGKFKSILGQMKKEFNELQQFVTLRNNLAHGAIEIFISEKREQVYVFETLKIDGENSIITKYPMLHEDLMKNLELLQTYLQKIENHSKKILESNA